MNGCPRALSPPVRRRQTRALLLCAVLVSIVACHRGVKYQRVEDFTPMPRVADGWTEKGIASWYGAPFHGRLTANGERYDMYKLSCAHKTLPLGTIIRVENRANGRHLDLRVNDRGPYVRGRIIDCSKAAAWRLGFLEEGLAPVRIQVVRRGTGRELYYAEPATREGSPETYEYTLQLGAFTDRSRAILLANRLRHEGEVPRIEVARVKGRQFHRVRVGRYPSKAGAADAAAALYARGHDVYIALME